MYLTHTSNEGSTSVSENISLVATRRTSVRNTTSAINRNLLGCHNTFMKPRGAFNIFVIDGCRLTYIYIHENCLT